MDGMDRVDSMDRVDGRGFCGLLFLVPEAQPVVQHGREMGVLGVSFAG